MVGSLLIAKSWCKQSLVSTSSQLSVTNAIDIEGRGTQNKLIQSMRLWLKWFSCLASDRVGHVTCETAYSVLSQHPSITTASINPSPINSPLTLNSRQMVTSISKYPFLRLRALPAFPQHSQPPPQAPSGPVSARCQTHNNISEPQSLNHKVRGDLLTVKPV